MLNVMQIVSSRERELYRKQLPNVDDFEYSSSDFGQDSQESPSPTESTKELETAADCHPDLTEHDLLS